MDWEKIGRISYKFLLYVIELGFKLCAFVAGWFALAAGGTLGMRIGTGFTSISLGLRHLLAAPAEFQRMSWLVRDYCRMGKDVFRQSYGAQAIEQFMRSINEGITFIQRINSNLYQHPLATVIATTVVFLTFYLLARIIRFARQNGRGSWLNRMEVRLGNSIFDRNSQTTIGKTTQMSQKESDQFESNGFSLKHLLSS